jgi:hypothetical protein
MMQRLRGALLRVDSNQPPYRLPRPNELRLEVVREERLRRDMRRAQQGGTGVPPPPEEQRARPRVPPVSPPVSARATSQFISALKSPSGLRHAWLLKEILGPPMALRGPHSENIAE